MLYRIMDDDINICYKDIIKSLTIVVSIFAITISMLYINSNTLSNKNNQSNNSQPNMYSISSTPASGLYDYNGSAAVSYGMMVHDKYYHSSYYPSGINESVLQKNLDHFDSEDCAHFVSEALIAGGLKALANNPPGDNLSTYDNGIFNGSYGIVGVYRLADYLAGYDLPIFPTNKTVEQTIGYRPIPASYNGSPHASIYYVLNESMLPSYYLSPGDVVMDGGVGNGHAMLYVGNGMVVQTDPANLWSYYPGFDDNISFYGMATLNGKNVSAIYIHMPTFSKYHSVNITVLYDNTLINNNGQLKNGAKIYLIASFPDGVGFGNYTYSWYDNGKLISHQQNFTYVPFSGQNNIEMKSTGTNGTAYKNYTLYVQPGVNNNKVVTYMYIIIPLAIVLISASLIYYFKKVKKS